MSFTAEVRDELARIRESRIECSKAELAALVHLEGTLGGSRSGHYRVEVATENAPVARKIITLAHNVYGLKTEFTPRRNVLHKTNNYLITFPSQSALAKVLDELGMMGGANPYWGVLPALVPDDECAIAYLRGAFLGAGFIADPKGDFHFEISVHSEQLGDDILALMQRFDIEPKIIPRRNGWTIYMKGIEPIIDFLALVGAHNALLRAEDVRVYKSMRNDVNRRVNAEVANQMKATDAALSQIESIRTIDERVGLDSLPRALKEFARLRLANPELSLRELGEAAKPPLSKSAVNHRVRRIEEVAQSLSE